MPKSISSLDGDSDTLSLPDAAHGSSSSSNSNVQVVVRVRPPSHKEEEQGYRKAALVDAAAQSLCLNLAPYARSFKFDYVADEDVGQEDMFKTVGKPITDACLQGYHCSLIAYGQTGAGKTFTMEGPATDDESGQTSSKRGLIPRILDYIFHKMAEEKKERSKDVEYAVKCSYLQIYNEQVQDLLDPDSSNLTIREDSKNGMYVEGLQEVVVPSAEATYGVFRRGSQNRHVGMTAMNIESSRSHSVFTLVVESQRNNGGVMNRKTSRFYLVDLAGSERQKYSETAGIRLKEAGSINKSLSALGNVIKALVDISEGKVRHVPYRDSKLTFLLKDALGGNSKCTLIANVSPADKNAEETLSTLKFAQRAKLMRNAAVVNEDMFGNPATMGEEIKRLRLEIAALRANVGASPVAGPLSGAEILPESERISRLENIICETTKQALAAERKAALDMHELATKLEASQALCERLETSLQSQKMITRLRECALKRLESGRAVDGDDSGSELAEEIEQLRKQVEHHPDVVRFKMELDLCKARLEEYEHKDRGDESSQMAQLENHNQALKLELQDLLAEKKALEEEIVALKQANESSGAQVLKAEEQFLKLQEAAERYRKEATDSIHKHQKAEEKLREAVEEQDKVWRMCNLAEAQATELALELAKSRSDTAKLESAVQKEKAAQECALLKLQVANQERDEARGSATELATKLDIAMAANALLEARVKDLEKRLLEKRNGEILDAS